ncbi:MAG TPA: right-handed parallel beta-helix repeat-containing protein [Archangium sp.]|nr:right-handed parallel beta-helix repeat-containing protein [Archangium sp.]
MANNVFWNNSHHAIVSHAADLDVRDNVVAGSQVGVFHAYGNQQGRVRCNVFFQNGGYLQERFLVPPWFELGQHGNVEAEPRFMLPERGHFHPLEDSPLVDAGCFGAALPDPDGTPQDVGAHGGPLGAWQ